MLDNNKLNNICSKINLSFDLILKNYCYTNKKNQKKLKNFIKKIYFLHTGKKINNIKLQYILLFTPLPSYFKVEHFNDNYLRIFNKYSFHSYPSNNILVGNIILPHKDLSPIPFFFNYKFNNKIMNKIQNIYYYEIIIDSKPFRESWTNQSISVGFGIIDTPIKNNFLGWSENTIGYNSFSGKIISDNVCLKNCKKYGYNDIVGAGIKYITENNYEFFFTLNGKLININKKFIISEKLTMMMSMDYSAAIDVNFGESNFCFDLNQLNSSNEILSTNNSFIKNRFNLKMFEFETNLSKLKLSIYKKIKFKDELTELLIKDENMDDFENEIDEDYNLVIQELNKMLKELKK